MGCYKFKICQKDIDPPQKLRPYTDCGHCRYHVKNVCERYFDEEKSVIRTSKPHGDLHNCRQPKGIPIFKDGYNSWSITSTTSPLSTEFTFKINDYPFEGIILPSTHYEHFDLNIYYDGIICNRIFNELSLKFDKKYTNKPILKTITHKPRKYFPNSGYYITPINETPLETLKLEYKVTDGIIFKSEITYKFRLILDWTNKTAHSELYKDGDLIRISQPIPIAHL